MQVETTSAVLQSPAFWKREGGVKQTASAPGIHNSANFVPNELLFPSSNSVLLHPRPSHFITRMPPQLSLPARALDHRDHPSGAKGAVVIFHSRRQAEMLSVRDRAKPCNKSSLATGGELICIQRPSLTGMCREGVFSLLLCCSQGTGGNAKLAQASGKTWAWVNHWISTHQSPTPRRFPVQARALPALGVTSRWTSSSHGVVQSWTWLRLWGLGALWTGGAATQQPVQLTAGVLLASRLHPSLWGWVGLCMDASLAWGSRGDYRSGEKLSFTWGDNEWLFQEGVQCVAHSKCSPLHTHLHTQRVRKFYGQIFCQLLLGEKTSRERAPAVADRDGNWWTDNEDFVLHLFSCLGGKKRANACTESVTCFWMYDKIDAIKSLLRS